jgi:hypothetical protein
VRVIGVDVGDDAAVPDDADEATLRDVVDDPAVARGETGSARVVGYELDPRSDRDTRLDAGRKETCASGIHVGVIGFDRADLDPFWMTFWRRTFGFSEDFSCRRAVPKSTA